MYLLIQLECLAQIEDQDGERIISMLLLSIQSLKLRNEGELIIQTNNGEQVRFQHSIKNQ